MRRVLLFTPILVLLAAAPAAPDLAAYAGKEPFEPVGKVTFFHHPAVVAGVAKVVPSPALRKMMLAPSGPSGPVVVTTAAVTADGCEVHNCGDHNWTIAIARPTRAATVCYHDAKSMGQRSRWYLAPGRTELRDGSCIQPDK